MNMIQPPPSFLHDVIHLGIVFFSPPLFMKLTVHVHSKYLSADIYAYIHLNFFSCHIVDEYGTVSKINK